MYLVLRHLAICLVVENISNMNEENDRNSAQYQYYNQRFLKMQKNQFHILRASFQVTRGII